MPEETINASWHKKMVETGHIFLKFEVFVLASCNVLIICMNTSVGNSEIPDVEGLTQCGAGKKTARRYMSNTFSLSSKGSGCLILRPII